MGFRKFPHVVVALTTLVAPLAALAQLTADGSVTTAPLATAPVMGMPVLGLLAVVLVAVAAYLLRPGAGRAIAVVGFVAVLTALAGFGYAFSNLVMVQGAQCAMPTTQMFDPNQPNLLVSQCQNSIVIVSLQGGTCSHDRSGALLDGVGPCRVGQILANGEDCSLPNCPC